jgi:hypothetical protein
VSSRLSEAQIEAAIGRIVVRAEAYEAGKDIWWCEIHKTDFYPGAPGCGFWMYATEGNAAFGLPPPEPCKIVKRRLCPPIDQKEE